MNDIFQLTGTQRFRDRLYDSQCFWNIQCAALTQLSRNRFPVHMLHGEIQNAVLLTDLEDLDQVAMNQIAGNLRLSSKPFDKRLVSRQVLVQDRHCHSSTESNLLGFTDRAHAPDTQNATETKITPLNRFRFREVDSSGSATMRGLSARNCSNSSYYSLFT